MVKRLKVAPFQRGVVVPKADDLATILPYFGGKMRDAQWIISHMPPHKYYVEVFGGGGAVFFSKSRSECDVYNDLGNVAVFWKVVRQWPEELYEKLFWTPYSRQEFEECSNTWEEYANKSRETGAKEDYIEFARRWFVQLNLSYSHREDDKSYKVAVQVNNASGFRNRVDLLPHIGERLNDQLDGFGKVLRSVIIEHLHFRDILRLYDRPDSLLYCDPPYTRDSRVSLETYRCELTEDEQVELLETLCKCVSQVMISGYDNELYNTVLRGWRTVKKTAPSAIQNRNQLEGRGDRTEVIWIKEHNYGLWSLLSDQEQAAQTDVATVPDTGRGVQESVLSPE